MTAEPEDRAAFDALVRAFFDHARVAGDARADGIDEPDGGHDSRPAVDADLLALFDRSLDAAAERPFELDDGVVTFVAEGDPELVGVRAAGLLDGQQVVVEAGELTVVLDVTRRDTDDGESHLIRGEVIGADEVLAVQLLDGVVEVALAVTDELGEFVFEDVPAGIYDLVVAGRHREVTATVTVL